MANYSISQLPTEATAQSTDLIETAIVDANSASGYASRKETLAVVGEAVVSDFQFPLLLTETTDKTIVGAINEVAQNAGGNVADEIANLKTSTDATISGGVATFDALDRLPLDALTIGIEYTQSGSGTPSPDNVRTINGFASAVISVTDGDTTETKTISFGSAGTVYGGTLDVKNGILTVNSQHIRKTLSEAESNNTVDNYTGYSYTFPNNSTSSLDSNGKICSICDVYSYSGPTNQSTHFYITTSGVLILVVPNGTSTDLEFDCICPLAMPLTYQLTPTEIKSLIGSNTVSADCGDVTICKYTALERIENQVTQYSTSEQKTGRKWIDGVDVYQKSFEITLPGSFDATNAFVIEADASYIDKLISADYYIKNTSGYIAGPGLPTAGWRFALYRGSDNKLVLYSGSGDALYGGTAYVTIEYTKN